MITVLIFSYVGLSFFLGGVAATVEMWSQPTMLDRASGRGKFQSPRMRLDEGLLFGLFVMILWPYLVIAMIVDVMAPGRDDDSRGD